jgi:hypothetical protein
MCKQARKSKGMYLLEDSDQDDAPFPLQERTSDREDDINTSCVSLEFFIFEKYVWRTKGIEIN